MLQEATALFLAIIRVSAVGTLITVRRFMTQEYSVSQEDYNVDRIVKVMRKIRVLNVTTVTGSVRTFMV